MTAARSDREAVMAACAELETAHEKVAALSYDALTHSELVSLLARRETIRRREPVIDHEIISRLAAETDPSALGATSLADALSPALRISKREARQRIKEAALLGPRRAMTGEPLPPKLPNVAAAQQRGAIGPEHVRVVEGFFDALPAHIPADLRDELESHLADLASGLGPTQFRQAADRLAYLANQDGDLPNDMPSAPVVGT